jgi:hypothetical protein
MRNDQWQAVSNEEKGLQVKWAKERGMICT